MEDEATLYSVFERRKLRYTLDPPQLRDRRLGVHRRWVRNPIEVAMELKEEMERRPDITQEDLAAERGVTRTRICQYLRLLDLPSDVVEFVRDPRNSQATSNVTESALRELLRIDSEVEVRRRFFEMVGDHAVAGVG